MKENEKRQDIVVHLPAPMGEIRPNPIITDPQGCYTGRPLEKYETPVQDADDL